jgi:hypothetical protein
VGRLMSLPRNLLGSLEHFPQSPELPHKSPVTQRPPGFKENQGTWSGPSPQPDIVSKEVSG